MSQSVLLSATLEDYLEEISRLVLKKGAARARDIAWSLSVHKSTVTAALRSLAEKGCVNYAPYEVVTLTVKGQKLAEQIIRRHEIIKSFLTDVLSVDEKIAEENACRMEHVIDRDVLDRLLCFVDFVKSCPRGGEKWVRGLTYFCNEDVDSNRCEKCIELCLEDFKKKMNDEKSKKEKTMRTTLEKLKGGQGGKIVRIKRMGSVTRRIVDMGVTKGTVIKVIKVAPLGDPIEVKVKGYNLSLRKDEASAITVEAE